MGGEGIKVNQTSIKGCWTARDIDSYIASHHTVNQATIQPISYVPPNTIMRRPHLCFLFCPFLPFPSFSPQRTQLRLCNKQLSPVALVYNPK